MRHKNLPVPAGLSAPVNARWLWWIGPPAAITAAYRLIPPRIRGRWALGASTSHLAMRQILSGGGWAAFVFCAFPRRRADGSLMHPNPTEFSRAGTHYDTWFPNPAR